MAGESIRISFAPDLTVYRDKLLSRKAIGTPVHAASFLRKRRIVLESALLANAGELKRILVHELFHFVWLRAGNAWRHSYEELLESECRARARGELGWSAEIRKQKLTCLDRAERSRRWREYVCESFCDSSAWFVLRPPKHHEFTLAPRYREARMRWFRLFFSERTVSL